MNKLYTVQTGDTITNIALKFYGNAAEYTRIVNANTFKSGTSSKLLVGEILVIPESPKNIARRGTRITADNSDDVSIIINGITLVGWTSVNISKNMDTCTDSFSLNFAWNPAIQEWKTAFRPFSNFLAQIFIGNNKIITGYIDRVSPSLSPNDRMMNIQGRSITAQIVDCSINTYPLEFQNSTLGQIATQLITPYSLSLLQPDGDTPPFPKVKAENGQKVFNFLDELAKQAGYIISSDENGNLVIWKAIGTGQALVSIYEGDSALKGGSSVHDASKRYSSYEAISQSETNISIVSTAKDPLINLSRAKIFFTPEQSNATIQSAADWAKSTALADSISHNITVYGWRDPNQNLWKENSIINLRAPSIQVYNDYKFLIAGVNFTQSESEGNLTTLRLKIPESYIGQFPIKFPWDEI